MLLNTARASFWNVIRIALQAGSLLALTRFLGAGGYGLLAGAVAIFITFAQLTGLGCGTALLRHLSKGGDLQPWLADTQKLYLATGALIMTIALPVSLTILPNEVGTGTLFYLAIAEIIVAPSLLPLASRFQAEERLFLSGGLQTAAPAARFLAVAVAYVCGATSLNEFSLIYLMCIALVTWTLLFIFRAKSTDRTRSSSFNHMLASGLPYAVSNAVRTGGGELDKTVLLRAAGDVAAGQYSAAFRIVQAATLPVDSFVLALTPGEFAKGTRRGLAGVKKLLAVVTGYATVAAVALWYAAPFVPRMLGYGFEDADRLVRLLCVVIFSNSLKQVVVMLLTTRDLQATRNYLEASMVVLSLGLMIWLVPRWMASGALAAMLSSDVIIIVTGLLALRLAKPKSS